MDSHSVDLLTQSRFVLDKALKLLDFSSEAEARFKLCPRTLSAELLLIRDDGSFTAVPAWRVQQAASLSIGPLRLDADLESAELQAQAAFYGWQSALIGLPFKGAAGGILTQAEFSSAERGRLLSAYVATFADLLSSGRDVLTVSDLTDSDCSVLLSALQNQDQKSLSGKPEALGGLPSAESAAGSGLFVILSEALRHQGRELSGLSVVIQGFGSDAQALARQLTAAGAKILAVSDQQGAICAHEGTDLDIQALIQTVNEFGSCTRHDGVELISPDDLASLACDVLVLSGSAFKLDARHADQVRASLILEAFPLAVNPEAVPVLLAQGVQIIPALLSTAGNLLAWALEWSEPLPGLQTELLNQRLNEVLPGLYERVLSTSNRLKTDLGTAALALALERYCAI